MYHQAVKNENRYLLKMILKLLVLIAYRFKNVRQMFVKGE